MNFKTFIESQVYYHGTRRQLEDIGRSKRFGGIHLGTKKAAIERLGNTPSERLGGRPEFGKIYGFQVNLKKPYNSIKNPITEHDLFLWLNAPSNSNDGKEWQEISKNYDGLYYLNNIEDPESISVLVFNKSALKLISVEKTLEKL